MTNQLVLTIGYDRESLSDPVFRRYYQGEIVKDHYGREVPKHVHGTSNLPKHTSSSFTIIKAMIELFDRIIDKDLLVRRITISANNIITETKLEKNKKPEQLDLFMDIEEKERQRKKKKLLNGKKNSCKRQFFISIKSMEKMHF